MEIIKHGIMESQKFIGKCSYCGCEFIAERSETMRISTTETWYAVDCPECGLMTSVEPMDVQSPKEVMKEAEDNGVGILGSRIQGCHKLENCPQIDEKILKETMVTTADIAMVYNDIMRRRVEDNKPWWKKILERF